MTTGRFLLVGLFVFSTTVVTRAGLEPDTLPDNLNPEVADAPADVDAPAEAAKPAVVVAPPPVVDAPAPAPVAEGETNVHVVATTPVAVAAVPLEPAALRRRRPLTAVAAAGRSDGEVVVGMIALDYHFDWQRALGERGVISPYCEFLLGYWEGEEGHTGVTSLHEAAVSLLLRYRYIRQPLSTFHPYVDAGIGLHYLTEDRIESKELGRNWQAGSNIGIGLLFPRDERFELGLRLRHLSNGGTDDSNWGVNQLLARFGVRF